jgi:uridine kinase
VHAFESVSTWQQSGPLPASEERTALIVTVAEMVAALGSGALRVAVDGLTGAGKTSFGHELAAVLRPLGRATMRASMGYYRNAYDSARDLLLGPAEPSGSGEVVLCGHDPLTGADHRDKKISVPGGAILIVDSVLAFRPEYNDCWEYRIWLDVDPETALRRGIARDRLDDPFWRLAHRSRLRLQTRR